MSKDYVISDLHLGHKKLVEVQKIYNNIEDKHHTIIRNWNNTVEQEDTIYVLGDVGSKHYIHEVIPKLKGRKILIMGNHDKYSKKFYEQYFDEVYNTPLYYHKRILLSHYPEVVAEDIINVHGHTHFINLNLKNYFNVSIENINATPIPMSKFIKNLQRMPKLSTKFLHEWYADHQVVTSPTISEDLVVNSEDLILIEETINHRKRKEDAE